MGYWLGFLAALPVAAGSYVLAYLPESTIAEFLLTPWGALGVLGSSLALGYLSTKAFDSEGSQTSKKIFTKEELAKYNGEDESLPIYVAVKGVVYDVSAKREMYGPDCGYNVFAGKDASYGLGCSSLKPEDAHNDTSKHTEKQSKVLNDWASFFQKRYEVVGFVN
eukprot:Nk52_evm10s554 gene=Nk52_evmTU10s554